MNYQKKLDGQLEEIALSGRVPTLLLHSCCAPCSSYCIEYLSRYFHLIVFYYNPNIYPPEEYAFRKAEQEHFIAEFPAAHPVSFYAGAYDPQDFYRAVCGLENEPEGGQRCKKCFRLRLTEAAREAAALGADYFATTLTISPMKNAEVLNTIGTEVGRLFGVTYLETDFKKKNGYLRSTELSREYHMYRQNYCGCIFSLRERQAKEKTGE